MGLKILSDFDGVWTDQRSEAEHSVTYLVEAAATAAGVALDEARAHFDGFLARTLATPERFGWAPAGRITAFVDEDPLLRSSALAWYLEVAGDDPLAAPYREAILGGPDATLADFGNRCFLESTARFRSEHPPGIVAEAREALARWVEAGAEVVVVSNSGADKIIGWFRHAGVDAGEGRGHALRVRGDARKWHIESGARQAFGERSVFVDRPLYRRAIVEEAPDVIVGDVFSLDLALACVMRRAGEPGAPRRLVLREHPHTPAWARAQVGSAVDAAVTGLGQVVPLLEDLRT